MAKSIAKSIDAIINLVLGAANQRRMDAGYGGRWDDGGASALQDQVKFYNYGRNNQIPPEWEAYAQKAEIESDPEFAEYQRLKTKFKNMGDK